MITALTPYLRATSCEKAREEITRLLRTAGCHSIEFMYDPDGELILQFGREGREISLRASAKGWAIAHLKNMPYAARMKMSFAEYEARALKQGQIAVNFVLRDWVKAQVEAIEFGAFSFETAFLPHLLTSSGQSVAERLEVRRLLTAEAGASK